MTLEKPLSPSQVRILTGVSTQQIYRDLESGFCPGWRGRDGKGRSWKIDPNHVPYYKSNLKKRTLQELKQNEEIKKIKAEKYLSLQNERPVKKSSREEIDDIFYQYFPDRRKKKVN